MPPTPTAPICRSAWQRQGWPTWALIVCVYCSWGVLMSNATELSWWLVSPLAAVILCLHGSVQHELLHGHPTPWGWFNDALGWLPLSLWIPYFKYRDDHRLHHRVDTLTDPGLDPESYYHWPERWQAMSPPIRLLWHLNYTFLGRMVIGPWLVVGLFLVTQLKEVSKGGLYHWRNWALHLVLMVSLILWLSHQGVIWWQYVVMCVWPGLSLTLMRSYAEHRPGSNNHKRCAIVEGSWFTRLLFMNVNLHQVHHEFPQLPWFMVNRHWQTHRQLILQRNGGYFYKGYWSLMRQTLLRQKDSPIYPKH